MPVFTDFIVTHAPVWLFIAIILQRVQADTVPKVMTGTMVPMVAVSLVVRAVAMAAAGALAVRAGLLRAVATAAAVAEALGGR